MAKKRPKTFTVHVPITGATGERVYQVAAMNEEEAIDKVKTGEVLDVDEQIEAELEGDTTVWEVEEND